METEIKNLVEEVKTYKTGVDSFKSDVETRLAKAETAIARGIETKEEPTVVTDVKSFIRGGKHKNKDFREFLTKGISGHFFETKADLSTGNVGIAPVIDQVLGRVIFESSPLASLAHVVTIGSGAPYKKSYNLNDAASGWVSETGNRTKTGSNTIYTVEINAHEQYAYPLATLASLEDAFYDVEGEVLWSAGDDMARDLAAALLFGSGDGSNQPTGILTGDQYVFDGNRNNNKIDKLNVVDAADGDAITLDDIITLQAALPSAYKAGAALFMNGQTEAALRKDAKDAGYLWEPNAKVGTPGTLFGMPVYVVPELESVGDGNISVLCGDPSKFLTIVNKVGVSVQKDTITQPGFAKYYVRARRGAKRDDGRALVALLHTVDSE